MTDRTIGIRGSHAGSASNDVTLFKSLAVEMANAAPVAPATAGRVFATESLSETDMASIHTAASNLQSTLCSVVDSLNLGNRANSGLAIVQETAAVQGALCASNPAAFAAREMNIPAVGGKDMFVVKAGSVPNYLGHRSKVLAAEAFDNRETRAAVLYTMAFNYTMARQDEFGETVWPTLTLPADQVGFGIVVNRLTIHRGVTHSVDGKAVNFGKVDLMRAGADHTVLQREKTRCYPIVRPAAVSKFVDAAIIAPRSFDNEGVTIQTAPLRVGAEVGIIGLSQTDAQLDGGSANQTDTLDPAISLENLYVKVGDDVVKFNVFAHSTANFTYAPQDVDKQRNLTFKSQSIKLAAATKQHDGAALVSLAAVATDNLTVVLELQATGTANTEFGSVQVFGNRVAIRGVYDADGEKMAATSAAVQDLEALFASAAIVGYDVRAYRTNINMRERGDFIDRTSFTQLYEVPLLSPITAQRPQSTDGQMDGGDFEALVTATRFRLKNDAVTAIFDSVSRIADHVLNGVATEDVPHNLGAARFHVKPVCYQPAPIDVATIVDSWASADRLKDLQAAIVNLVRDYAFKMYVESEYQSASDAMGVQGPATIIIATDPILARYIMVDGDLRTLTEKFNIRVVSTIDKRFKGKMFVTFGVFDENRNQAPNILNWGNLVWAPEVVMSASVPRGESMSRETIVQPRYLFVNHLPVCTMLSLENVSDTFNKIPVNFKQL